MKKIKLPSLKKPLTKKQKIRYSIIGAVALLVLLIGAVVYSQTRSQTTEDTYETVKLKKADDLTFKGVVEATTTQDYYMDQSLGKITAINVTDGQEIAENTVLLTYENQEYQNQAEQQSETIAKLTQAVTSAQESLAAAQTRQARAQQQVNEATNNYNVTGDPTQKEMYKQERDQYQAALETAQDGVLQARQALDLANVDLNSANQSVAQAQQKVTQTVTSTSAGKVYVNEKGKNDATTPVVQVISDEVSIEGTATEYDYSRLQQDQNVTIRPNVTDQEIAGTITRVGQLPEQAPATTTQASSGSSVSNYSFTVKPAENLQYGYNVQISLPVDEIRLPRKAVVNADDEQYVYLVKDGKAKRTKVETEDKDGYLIVVSGLKENDRIVSNPDSEISDGQTLAVN